MFNPLSVRFALPSVPCAPTHFPSLFACQTAIHSFSNLTVCSSYFSLYRFQGSCRFGNLRCRDNVYDYTPFLPVCQPLFSTFFEVFFMLQNSHPHIIGNKSCNPAKKPLLRSNKAKITRIVFAAIRINFLEKSIYVSPKNYQIKAATTFAMAALFIKLTCSTCPSSPESHAYETYGSSACRSETAHESHP